MSSNIIRSLTCLYLMRYSFLGSLHCGRTIMGRCFMPTGSSVESTQSSESPLIHWSWLLSMNVKTCCSIMYREKWTSCTKLHQTTGSWRSVGSLDALCVLSWIAYLEGPFIPGWGGCWPEGDWRRWEEFLLSVLVWHRVCSFWDSS